MNAKTPYEYFQKYNKTYNYYTDLELISSFNSGVDIRAFNFARSGRFRALKEQLKKRKIDYSSVGDESGMSYKYCVILKDKKLYKITELCKSEVENIFNKYIKNTHLLKIFKPKIIGYNNDFLQFEMAKHFGVLNINVNKMIKKLQKE